MTDSANLYRQSSVMLVANKLHQDYSNTVHDFGKIEPEKYLETWLGLRIIGDYDHKFRDEVCEVFMVMLQESGRRNG